MQGTFKGYNYKVIGSFTKNYGNYYFYPNEQLFTSTNILFDFNKHFKNFGGIDAGILVAADLGSMYSKNLGIMIKLSKKGNFIL
jgi:hypothetical protein